MSNDRADYYREQAELCRQAAEAARERDKAGWLKVAGQWLTFAEQAEGLSTECRPADAAQIRHEPQLHSTHDRIGYLGRCALLPALRADRNG
jgi:hypothetical protein